MSTPVLPLGAEPTDTPVPPELSVLPRKRLLYGIDTYFRESWWDLQPIAGALAQLTFCAFKPDALAGRRIGPCLDLLERHGFGVVASAAFAYDRLSIRETWRYQFNVASADRIAVVDALLTAAPSVLVVLEDRREPSSVPASVRLGSLKGPSEPHLREPGQIRHELGVVTGLFNFVHTADEPADFVRELGVLLGGVERRRLVDDIRRETSGRPEADRLVARLESEHPAHDLDAQRSERRLRERASAAVLARLDAALAGHRDAWRAFFEQLPEEHLWDGLSVATAVIEVNVSGLEPVLPGVAGQAGLLAWQGELDGRAP